MTEPIDPSRSIDPTSLDPMTAHFAPETGEVAQVPPEPLLDAPEPRRRWRPDPNTTVLSLGVAVSVVLFTFGIVVGLLTSHPPGDTLTAVYAAILGAVVGMVGAGLMYRSR